VSSPEIAAQAAPPSAKVSALKAAARVLSESKQAMTCPELIAAMGPGLLDQPGKMKGCKAS
jgi:hypothetical protein